MNPRKVQAVVDRMRWFFSSQKVTEVASKELVLKWAREIEAALKEK